MDEKEMQDRIEALESALYNLFSILENSESLNEDDKKYISEAYLEFSK